MLQYKHVKNNVKNSLICLKIQMNLGKYVKKVWSLKDQHNNFVVKYSWIKKI